MVNSNRLVIGLIILSLTVFFYFIQIDKLFFFIVSALIISEIYKINLSNKFERPKGASAWLSRAVIQERKIIRGLCEHVHTNH